jgi:hypothetical protein
MEQPKEGGRTARTILFEMLEAVKAGNAKDLNNPQLWINRGQELNILLIDEKEIAEKLRQKVALLKLAIYQKQEKKNVTAATLEVETLNEYRDLRIQDGIIEIIEEQIMLAKKNADINH